MLLYFFIYAMCLEAPTVLCVGVWCVEVCFGGCFYSVLRCCLMCCLMVWYAGLGSVETEVVGVC